LLAKEDPRVLSVRQAFSRVDGASNRVLRSGCASKIVPFCREASQVKQFGTYPIYINHPGRWEAVRQRQRDEFVDKGDFQMMSWLDSTGKRLYEITEDKTPGPEAVAYENRILALLATISSTKVGKLLFDSLNGDVKHWIVPLDSIDKADCSCGAETFPGAPKEGGGVRIYCNPTDFSPTAGWMSADDILFHELVHAYRDGRVGYAGNNFKPMNEYKTAEEFLALHMQNVYLACRGSARFYRSYRSLQSVSKSTAYQYFANDAEVLMAFRHFVANDPLAAAVARWMHPPESFNPWRDRSVLERIYLSNSPGLSSLPAF